MSREQSPKSFLSLQDVKNAAKETLLQQGSHTPLVIADGTHEAVFTHIEQMAADHEERLSQMMLLGLLIAETGRVGVLYQVFFVTEAWLSLATNHRPASHRPSQDPHRKEVLIVSQQIVQPRQNHLAMVEMKRNAKGRLMRLEDIDLYPTSSKTIQAESPLLDAFTDGFLASTYWGPSPKDN